MNDLLKVNRTARVNHEHQRVEVLNDAGHVIWAFDPVELAMAYFTMSPEQFYATYMFLWVPCEPYATRALEKLGECKI